MNNALDPYPYYYGSNIIYRGDMVYVNGVPYVSASEYYRQARALAHSADVILQEDPIPLTVENGPILAPPDGSEKQTVAKPALEEEWFPMGTYAFLDGEGQVESKRIIQLATNKEGRIRGNYIDEEAGTSYQLVGAVDSKTQRVAFRFVGEEDTVLECGLWNLTQDSVPVLLHRGEAETEQETLVRLAEEEDQNRTDTGTMEKQEGPFIFGPTESELAP